MAKKERPPIPEDTKVELLRETNYRCGYCLKNITPVAYETENRYQTHNTIKEFVKAFNKGKGKLTVKNINSLLPRYIQQYDVAHIVPFEESQDNSYYNLIALCTACHRITEQESKNSAIPRNKLKELKLHWLIASGRFTKLEIDLLMKLYHNTVCFNTPNKIQQPSFTRIKKLDGSKWELNNSDRIGTKLKAHHVEIIPRNLLILVQNIIKNKFCRVHPEIPPQIHVSFSDIGQYTMPNHEIELDEDGTTFCEKFYDAHKEEQSANS